MTRLAATAAIALGTALLLPCAALPAASAKDKRR